jgi:hypothetical protein
LEVGKSLNSSKFAETFQKDYQVLLQFKPTLLYFIETRELSYLISKTHVFDTQGKLLDGKKLISST